MIEYPLDCETIYLVDHLSLVVHRDLFYVHFVRVYKIKAIGVFESSFVSKFFAAVLQAKCFSAGFSSTQDPER